MTGAPELPAEDWSVFDGNAVVIEPARLRLQPIRWTDLKEEQGEPLIEDLLDCGDFSIVYGPSGCGKTFLTLDMALHIVLGRPWRGRPTTKRSVVYIAAESSKSIKRRVMAFHLHHDIDPAETADAFRVIAQSVNLLDPTADLEDLVAGCLADDAAPGLIVGDTVSRLLAGGDENQSGDMGALVMNLDRLREATGAHILGVHHTGKDVARGARGWSGLRAAVDTEIEVTNAGGLVTATVSKQRDYEDGQNFSFKIEALEVGKRPNGKPITSCALNPIEMPDDGRGKERLKMTAKQTRALDCLRNCMADMGKPSPAGPHYPEGAQVVSKDQWREHLFSSGVLNREAANPRRDFARLYDQLCTRNLIREWNGLLWLCAPEQGCSTVPPL